MLVPFQAQTHLIFTTISRGRYEHYPCFIDEETVVWRGSLTQFSVICKSDSRTLIMHFYSSVPLDVFARYGVWGIGTVADLGGEVGRSARKCVGFCV
jgi:hypothetical protein